MRWPDWFILLESKVAAPLASDGFDEVTLSINDYLRDVWAREVSVLTGLVLVATVGSHAPLKGSDGPEGLNAPL